MTNGEEQNDALEQQLDILRLLDERFRLREDPERQRDLEQTHARLRERLQQQQDNDA